MPTIAMNSNKNWCSFSFIDSVPPIDYPKRDTCRRGGSLAAGVVARVSLPQESCGPPDAKQETIPSEPSANPISLLQQLPSVCLKHTCLCPADHMRMQLCQQKCLGTLYFTKTNRSRGSKRRINFYLMHRSPFILPSLAKEAHRLGDTESPSPLSRFNDASSAMKATMSITDHSSLTFRTIET